MAAVREPMRLPTALPDMIGPVLSRLSLLAPRPASLDASGLTPQMLADLVLKHLLRAGSLTAGGLSERLGLIGTVIDPITQFLRQEGQIHLQSRASLASEVRSTLTERGRQAAEEAVRRCGYVGPAPVPLATASRLVREQTVPRRGIGREQFTQAFGEIIMSDALRERLGVALASRRAIFIYGPAGTGKTYIASRLIAALTGEILIPHAITVNGKVVRVFDAAVHERIDLLEGNRRLLLAQGYDARFALCERPMIIVGGEMTEAMMDVQFNAISGEYDAPLQMKANGGLLVIDDLGRQRFLPQRLFDRWIVPLEQQLDYLAAGVDARFVTPCDPIIVFSTNLEPAELADDAVLRRLGYKIEIGPLSVDLYSRMWASVCDEMNVEFNPRLLGDVLNKLYRPSGRPLLACHPRDLISMALDKANYDERGKDFTVDDLSWAWSNYFLPGERSGDAAKRGDLGAR
jgi:hypothetical protein